jgi:hypothetical protein
MDNNQKLHVLVNVLAWVVQAVHQVELVLHHKVAIVYVHQHAQVVDQDVIANLVRLAVIKINFAIFLIIALTVLLLLAVLLLVFHVAQVVLLPAVLVVSIAMFLLVDCHVAKLVASIATVFVQMINHVPIRINLTNR